MNRRYLQTAALFTLAFGGSLLAGCGERDGEVQEFSTEISLSEPDGFMRFFDPQASLPPGHYTLVVATQNNGESGSFSGTVTRDDGTELPIAGSWSSSGGNDKTSTGNPGINIELQRAGGLQVSVTSSVDVCLYLLRDQDQLNPDTSMRGGQEYAPGDGVTCIDEIDLPASAISSVAYARKYYAAIDPGNDRDTLSKWQLFNGFGADGSNFQGHVRFRDTRDLGYGRNMFFRVNDNGTFAAFVDNFQVQTIPGEEYTSLNLDALVADDRSHHIGTNAIEYSCADPTNCDCRTTPEACFVKFFTFLPASGGSQARALTQDLDGRGEKPMPGICITCHGGDTPPLDLNGDFPNNGNTNSKLHLLEVDHFEYSTRSDLTRAAQEATFKALNQAIYCTYPGASAAVCSGVDTPTPPTPADDGEWHAELIVAQAEVCYGADFSETTFGGNDGECDFVPAGWEPDPNDGNPPAGADELFREVVQPHCIVCHGRRGSNLGPNSQAGVSQDIDFSSWQRFISHADQIERLVFDEGLMPLALLNYNVFWADPNKAALLGSFLPGFTHGNPDGTTQMPGDPVADPGPDLVTTLPARLSAAASLFADAYSWEVIASPANATFSFSDPSGLRPLFNGDTDGEYQLRLTVSNGTDTHSAVVSVTHDSTLMPAPADITFDDHVAPMLQANCGATCHQASGGVGAVDGVPVFWNDTDQTADQFYRETIARVNFVDPADSLILRKPTGNHHYGDQVTGFDTDDVNDRDNYDLLLNWIVAGANRAAP